MKNFGRAAPSLLIALLILVGSGCSTLSINDDPQKHVASDPLEKLNRSVYSFNRTADKVILRPIAKGYDSVLPAPAKKGVRNFFDNLQEPLNIVHNLLQGKTDRALNSTYRFAVNSTVGLLGLIDVAQGYDVNPAPEDFGQTLAAWGVGPGPYLMLPFLGPSNLRDSVGRAVDSAAYYPINEITDSGGARTGLVFLDVISFRAGLLRNDKILLAQVDEYSFLKSAFEQARVSAIYNGDPPTEDEEDFDDF